jgi:hypothetical protein
MQAWQAPRFAWQRAASMETSMQAHPTSLPAVAFLAFVAVTASPAMAQNAPALLCHDHGELTKALLDRYHEVPVSIGLQTDGQLLQVFASAETGTWTILMTRPDGVACILSAGKHFEQRPLTAPGPTAKADRNDERAG